jgi:hypothetical protein
MCEMGMERARKSFTFIVPISSARWLPPCRDRRDFVHRGGDMFTQNYRLEI